MSDAKTFQISVIRPALSQIGHAGEAAEQLVLGTGIQESRLTHRRQIGGGPARGLFQMEPATHDDIWKNFLSHRGNLKQKVESLLSKSGADKLSELENNDKYAAAMCRVYYLRAPEALPAAGDIQAMANYWKKYYNTAGGKGKPEEFVANWKTMMGGGKLADTVYDDYQQRRFGAYFTANFVRRHLRPQMPVPLGSFAAGREGARTGNVGLVQRNQRFASVAQNSLIFDFDPQNRVRQILRLMQEVAGRNSSGDYAQKGVAALLTTADDYYVQTTQPGSRQELLHGPLLYNVITVASRYVINHLAGVGE